MSVDGLTGCLTGAVLLPRLDQLLDRATPDRAVTVLLFDLDGLHRVNLDHGHQVGDELLTGVAHRLTAAAGPRALVGRVGGDEFLVVSAGPGGSAQAQAEAIRLRDAVLLVTLMEGRVASRVSVGSAWTDRQLDSATLLAAADADLQHHKIGRRR